MRVLVVKLTSMGDVLHLMPALSDLKSKHSGVAIDWMVEDSFAEIPTWHPSVDKVISVSTRRWRKINKVNISEFFSFIKDLRSQRYDYVVDAQGLMKSAVFARFAKVTRGGVRAGFSGDSIKESPAAWFYQNKVVVGRQQHAISRLRQLFAGAFGYSMVSPRVDYGLSLPSRSGQSVDNRGVIMLFHGTTWPTKHLPDQVWREIADLASDDGYKLKVCWGNEPERLRAEWIAQGRDDVTILPKSSLIELAHELSSASGAVAVDTGLGHMAAALGIPTVSVYGSTDAELTGTLGNRQLHLQSEYPCSPCLLKNCDKLSDTVDLPPCYKNLSASKIWQTLYEQIV